MKKIKVAIAGVGNCASSLVQGVEYYKHNKLDSGVMMPDIGGYLPTDIEFVVGFDVDARKVNKPLSEAIYAKPNCCMAFVDEVEDTGAMVYMGQQLDGVADHMKDYPEHQSFVVSKEKAVDVVKILKELEVDVLISYMPVGSEQAAKFYANCALEAKVGFVNNMPVFIASTEEWSQKFEKAGVPIIGDDIKSQVGATIVHRVLTRLFGDRGYTLDKTYQLNTGGNTDFLNMLERKRLASKKISKTQAVISQLDVEMHPDNVHVGPSDYVPWQKDNKICFIHMRGRGFGGAPIELDLKLSVQDSPNSAGVVIDAIRYVKTGLDNNIAGVLEAPSAYLMKSPIIQIRDSVALELCQKFAKSGEFRDSQIPRWAK
jgi:myo-inositol-1-phosphate synthase